ncbi:MAG: hypothetical protein JJT82_03150 [Legionellaceae bacterium]|nr:hypothetical protein [Legionellaceae bacterium]
MVDTRALGFIRHLPGVTAVDIAVAMDGVQDDIGGVVVPTMAVAIMVVVAITAVARLERSMAAVGVAGAVSPGYQVREGSLWLVGELRAQRGKPLAGFPLFIASTRSLWAAIGTFV